MEEKLWEFSEFAVGFILYAKSFPGEHIFEIYV